MLKTLWCKLFHRRHYGYEIQPPIFSVDWEGKSTPIKRNALMDKHGDRHDEMSYRMECAKCARSWWVSVSPLSHRKVTLERW